MTKPSLAPGLALALAFCACNGGSVSETLFPTDFTATTQSAQAPLAAMPGFADERGGGVFIAPDGGVARVRIDGSVYAVEGHPSNPVAPGLATAAWAIGPYEAVVATSTGLFVVLNGWLIAPPWSGVLSSDGLIATAVGDNGVAWVAHKSGLFRIENGDFSELKAGGTSLTGITALAVGPGADGASCVWFAQGNALSYAERTSTSDFIIKDSGLMPEDLTGGIVALAGIGASATSAGELWAITQQKLWRYFNATWVPYDTHDVPKALKAAGRTLWLRSGDALFRYDADAMAWGDTKGLPSTPTLLAVDASGAAWVQLGDATQALTVGLAPRIDGLFQNEQLYGSEASITAELPVTSNVSSVLFKVDSDMDIEVDKAAAVPGEGPLADMLYFSMGGNDATQAVKPFSFAAYPDGPHTLTATARYSDMTTVKRVTPFVLQSGLTGAVGWVKDIKPIYDDRCSKCHAHGPGRDLTTYDAWKLNDTLIESAVKDMRMPADGPLDPALIQKIARWVVGGDQP